MTAPDLPETAGPPTWRIFAAFGVVVLLLAALVVVSQSDAEPVLAPGAVTNAAPATTSAQAAATGPASDEARVLADTADALAAWGVFAATGELDEVSATFAAGPQLEQLRSEAADRTATAPGLPAFRFAMSDSDVIALDGEVASVQTAVTMSRPGTDPSDFRWQIELRWDGDRGRWMLYTVATVPEE